jgi:Bromodomain
MDEISLESCKRVLEELMSEPACATFVGNPLDSLEGDEKLKEEYRSVVDTPIDLGEISKDLKMDKISTIDEFESKVRLCFENSKKFCKQRFPDVYAAAVYFAKTFKTLMSEAKTQARASAPAPPSTSSRTSTSKSPHKKVPVIAPVTRPAPSAAPVNVKKEKERVNASRDLEHLHFEDKCIRMVESFNRSFKWIYEELSKEIDFDTYRDYPKRYIMIHRSHTSYLCSSIHLIS